jgi:hypothetical protein
MLSFFMWYHVLASFSFVGFGVRPLELSLRDSQAASVYCFAFAFCSAFHFLASANMLSIRASGVLTFAARRIRSSRFCASAERFDFMVSSLSGRLAHTHHNQICLARAGDVVADLTMLARFTTALAKLLTTVDRKPDCVGIARARAEYVEQSLGFEADSRADCPCPFDCFAQF